MKARNTSAASENKIHDDAVARRYGFAGGLVPGVTVYAYLTRPLVQSFGPAWLARGTCEVKFVKPVLAGEELAVTGEITARDATGATVRLTGATASGTCAEATATVPAGSPVPVNGGRYAAAPLPAERPPVSREHLAALAHLGTPEALYDSARATEYLDKVGDDLRLYESDHGWVHPAFYLDQANRALDRNVRLGPWIHVASRIRHLGGARVGDRLETRGRVRSLYEKRSRDYVELDLLIVAGDTGREIAHVLHTAIYRL